MNTEKQIINVLLEQRNYSIIDSDDNRFIAQANDKFMLVIFSQVPLNNESIKSFLSMLNNLAFTHMMIIYTKSITPSAKKIIINMAKQDIHIEVFQAEKLIDITKHRLYRKHEKIIGKEELEIRGKYGNKLPKILITDPVVRWHGFKVHDILRIKRKGGFIAYRLVGTYTK
jgi:DNA-directed RNA polymerase I, II, and III subunit RPABC1